MRVLGIDAAWISREPSGVALIDRSPSGWRLVAAAASYEIYQGKGERSAASDLRARGSLVDAAQLLKVLHDLSGGRVDLVAFDMPLAMTPIATRRLADNAVSRAYGTRKCDTHTPNIERPGPIGEALQHSFEASGFELCTSEIRSQALIEVHPHPALVELARAGPYKLSKARAYWPALSPAARRQRDPRSF